MQDEIFEIVDSAGRTIGQATRLEIHNKSYLLHKVVHVLVFNGDGRLLLQKRSMNKDIFPGKWDTSVGGHVMPGEDILSSAIRETQEELGFIPENLNFLYSYIYSGRLERELVYSYSIIKEGNFSYNKEEIDGVKFWSIEDIRSSLGSGIFSDNFEYEIGRYLKYLKNDMVFKVLSGQ